MGHISSFCLCFIAKVNAVPLAPGLIEVWIAIDGVRQSQEEFA
jgi:hypothetical protein